MLVYVPVTNFNPNAPTHDVKEIESTQAKYHKATQYSDSIHYHGIIYNGNYIFKNPDGAMAWWNQDFKTMREAEIKAHEIEWLEEV